MEQHDDEQCRLEAPGPPQRKEDSNSYPFAGGRMAFATLVAGISWR